MLPDRPHGVNVIIPRPVKAHAHPDDSRVMLTADGFVIAADEASRPVAALLRAALEASTGWDIAVVPVSGEIRPNAITLTVGLPDGSGLPDDGYRLHAAPGEGVVINAGGPAGVFYAAQTLRLLLPSATLRKAPAQGVPATLELPAVEIEDAPRYAWRGVHLDVARHFFPKAWILRLIDLAVLHKLNVLHLHLTDDQGWRFPVRHYPLLTEVGSWRKQSPVGLAGEKRFDGTPHSGCYTVADLAEIVAYAAQRHMTVVPEIDLPGHMQAAIAAYPELGNRDTDNRRKKPVKVPAQPPAQRRGQRGQRSRADAALVDPGDAPLPVGDRRRGHRRSACQGRRPPDAVADLGQPRRARLRPS